MLFPTEEEVMSHLVVARRVKSKALNHYVKDLPEIEMKRVKEWNDLKEDGEWFEDNDSRKKGWKQKEWDRFTQEVLAAKLIISTCEFLNNKRNPISQRFSNKDLTDDTVYRKVQDFEEFSIFDNRKYTTDLIIEDIAKEKRDVIGFIKKFCEKQFYNADRLMDDLKVEPEVTLALRYRYKRIFDKIGDAIKQYIKDHPGTWVKVFTDIDRAYMEILKSHEIRAKLQEELDKNILAQEKVLELQNHIQRANNEQESIRRKLSKAESELCEEKVQTSKLESEIDALESEKDSLVATNMSMLGKWEVVFDQVEKRRRDLEMKEKELEALKQDIKQENKALLEDELGKVRKMADELEAKEIDFRSIKMDLKHQNDALSERLMKMRKSLETGEMGTMIKTSQARAMQRTFLTNVARNIKSHLDDKVYRRKFKAEGIIYDDISHSERSIGIIDHHDGEEGNGFYPMSNSVTLNARKKRLFGRGKLQMKFEGIVMIHEESFQENGFDNVSISLSEIQRQIEDRLRSIREHPKRHVVYLASPTGFDNDVIKRASGKTPGESLGYHNVIVFLQNLNDPSSSPIYNTLDDQAKLISDFIQMPSVSECINRCKFQVLKALDDSPMTFIDLIESIDMSPRFIKKALNELTKNNKIGHDKHVDYDDIYYKKDGGK